MSSLRDSQYYDLYEVVVEMVPAEDRYPDLDETAMEATETLFMDNSEADHFEIPRGALRLSMPLYEHFPSPVPEDQDSKKTRMFMDAIRGDGNWARSLNQVKLSFSRNSYLKDNITDVFTHFIRRVNTRGRAQEYHPHDKMRRLGGDSGPHPAGIRQRRRGDGPGGFDVPNPLQECHEHVGKPHPSSVAPLQETRTAPFGQRHLRRAQDLLHFEHSLQDEEYRRLLPAGGACRTNPSREVLISWYDQYKEGPGGGHVTYIYFDHNAYRQTEPRVTFGEVTISSTFEVPHEKMVPLSVLQPVKDLIDFLHRTSVGSNSM